jgi:hypothetical protein
MAMGSRRTRFQIRQHGLALAGALALGALTVGAVCAQSSEPPPSPPQDKPGVFEAIGRWFDDGASRFNEHLRGAKQRMDQVGDDAATNSKQIEDGAAEIGKGAAEVGKGAAEATKNAVDAVVRLPTSRVMRGRERCEIAPNGAPDCVTAAEALCRKHGFATGKSIDFTSAEECPARSYIGQGREECTTVTFISQAMCQ